MKKNISIIIPLKDRSEFTLRILYYLSNINFAFKIFICDGSYNKSINRKIVKKFKSKLDLTYLSFPFDLNYDFFLKKIKKTLSYVKTSHVMLLPNDDFINLLFLNTISKKKNYNKSISGINLDFKINNFIRYKNDYGKTKFYTKVKKQYHEKLNDRNIYERLKYIHKFNPYESIHSKKILLKVINNSIKFSVKNHKEFMWFFKLIPLIHTRVDFLNKPLIARQVNTYSGEGLGLSFKENFSSKNRLVEFKKFIFLLTKDKKLQSMIIPEDFPFKPIYSFDERMRIYLVSIKNLLKRNINFQNFKKDKTSENNYNKLFEIVKNKFKHY